ncbi:hypothetical protein KL86DPRO_60186 [uncultured delta proteobacterium]|uniref:Uncharacterized protein n=1 Tax=uncultured delta proteobacterium TaxID=34034 RepID=A0A212KG37_9DELT|nr:hypothetical protein KL86DPRO_60186 [uncultured delta proteobacterium]
MRGEAGFISCIRQVVAGVSVNIAPEDITKGAAGQEYQDSVHGPSVIGFVLIGAASSSPKHVEEGVADAHRKMQTSQHTIYKGRGRYGRMARMAAVPQAAPATK